MDRYRHMEAPMHLLRRRAVVLANVADGGLDRLRVHHLQGNVLLKDLKVIQRKILKRFQCPVPNIPCAPKVVGV